MKMAGKNLEEAGRNGKALQGRRRELDVGSGRRKRPLTADIEKTSQDNRKMKRAKKENALLFIESGPRTLRSGRKLEE